MPADYIRGSRFNCPKSGALTSKVSAYLKGGPSASQKVKVVLYKDDGHGGNWFSGTPGTYVATSAEVVIASGAAAAWVDFTLATTLAAGNYWVCLHTGSTTGQAYFYSDSNWFYSQRGHPDSYTDGAAATWSTASDTSTYGAIAAYVTYTVVDATAPTCSITVPATDAQLVGASVTLTAAAADNVGVAGVQFQVDGANVGSEDVASPFSITWDSTTVDDGQHVITAVARDAAGNTKTSDGVKVTTKNRVDYAEPMAGIAAITPEF